ncbi:acyltransferase family protein [Enteractinococcus fodinae]|uniref:Peptidoglycan/LPS O-acetylase OafA/YrhL n=1 Tax=Enteractinococcus fodinae TaxID=684663 RepID=A0ABU2B0Y7_9MICC|nr:acyltransferase family protein [Enteractinococcus fodinae]MDR7346951.1 peptidoglycan/LPS O-acetylase OafA/YrhL [Enteractinococcus fodinae]
MTSATIKPPNEPAVKAGSKFRPDIQGLRAVAVGLVLLYHAGLSLFPGGYVGVDVFFVISGFLITGMLVRQAEEHGRIDLADFYARRIRRILPAATIVLAFVAVLTISILPRTRWDEIGVEVIASAFYLVNWVLADGTDYLNAEEAASPIQHFWTLAVEEQFYILWPALLVGLLWFASRRSRNRSVGRTPNIHRYLKVGVAIAIVPSFIWSIYYTDANPAPAYFVTTTRLWEIAIGAALAIFAVQLQKLPHSVGYILQGGGLLAILAAGLFYTSATPFPGYAALLPTLGAAAVIVGGMSGRATEGFARVLNVRPMRWIGDLSYSLYLWHWPLLVFAAYLADGDLPVGYGLLIVTLAIIPSWLSYRYIEEPFRNWQRLKEKSARALRAGASLMVTTTVIGLAVLVASAQLASDDSSPQASNEPMGAEAIELDAAALEPVNQVSSMTPDISEVEDDVADVYADGCHGDDVSVEVNPCVYGDADSDYVVAIVGDSHAAHWIPTLQKIAEAHGWRLETYTKSACALNTVAVNNGGSVYESCYEWGQNVLEHFTGSEAPDHVIASASSHSAASSSDAPEGVRTGDLEGGYEEAWTQIEEEGVGVTVILDTPRPSFDVPECIAENEDSLTECAADRDEAMASSGHEGMLSAAEAAGVDTVDMSDALCSPEACAPVVGGVIVWRDGHHITATYAETLAQILEEKLRENSSVQLAD